MCPTFPIGVLIDAYFIPYLFFVAWLDLVTYLQHTDGTLIYYRDNAARPPFAPPVAHRILRMGHWSVVLPSHGSSSGRLAG